MAELADALDSGSSEGFPHTGSSPAIRTKLGKTPCKWCLFEFLERFHAGLEPVQWTAIRTKLGKAP